MPSLEIPDGPTTIEASRASDATAVYGVTNVSPGSCDVRLSVVPSGGTKTEWFNIDGNRERTFAAGETQSATVRVRIPPDVPAGEYPFRLRAVAINDPDNDHAEGPMTIARLGPAEVGKKSLLWLWILLGLLGLIVIGAGLYFALHRPGKGTHVENAAETPPPAKIDTEQALKLAEKKTADWITAFNNGDKETLLNLSEPPFYLGDELLLNKADIEKKYGTILPRNPERRVKITGMRAYTIADLKKTKLVDASAEKWLNAQNLRDEDIGVVAMMRPDAVTFYFRRLDQDVQMAGFWSGE
jgi:hypothetical protein